MEIVSASVFNFTQQPQYRPVGQIRYDGGGLVAKSRLGLGHVNTAPPMGHGGDYFNYFPVFS